MSGAYTVTADPPGASAVPARVSSRLIRALPLAALLAAAPSAVRAQASGSVVARATVASTLAPRLELSLAAAPTVATARPVVFAAGGAAGDVVEVTSVVRVTGNTGYRLLVRARAGAAGLGLAVRDASGSFRSLAEGEAVEVARGSGHGQARSVVYRVSEGAAMAEPPVVYELVYDPVA